MDRTLSVTRESEENLLTLAHIYTLDESYVKPLREFLESNQCRVYVNPEHSENPRYFIVCGDTQFVKGILDSTAGIAENPLIILWDDVTETGSKQLIRNGKIVTINRAADISLFLAEIFSFYFTSGNELLSLFVPELEIKIPFPNTTPKELPPPEPVESEIVKEISVSRAPDKIPDRDYLPALSGDTDRIRKTIESVYKTDNQKTNDSPTLSGTHSRKSILWPFFLAAMVIVAPYVWYVVSMMFGLLTLGLSVRYVTRGNMRLAQTTVTASRHWISQSRSSLFLIGIPFRLLTVHSPLASQELTVSFMNDSQEALSTVTRLMDSTKLLTKSVFPDLYDPAFRNGSLPILVDSYRTNLPFVIDRLGLAEAELKKLVKDGTFPFSVHLLGNAASDVMVDLESARNRLEVFQRLLSMYTEAGGFKKQATYLVLFQNSMELRPTGGFIGSLAEVQLLDGGIEMFKVYDVYDIDGQLKGHSDPPEPIRSLLGQEHWYLRDSNWDPDFSVSGHTAAWFFEKSTGRKVDGVIAVNSPFVTDILSATGPVFLPDFNDTVTAENFYGKALYYIEQSFFPGSTQKKDFLGALMNALILSINKPEDSNRYLLAEAVEQGINSRDIMFYFREPDLEHLVRQYGWGGEWIAGDLCRTGDAINPKCYSDIFGVIDTNLSMNKVNYFVSRTQETDIRFTEKGDYLSVTRLTYENTSSGNAGEGGGNYRNYERMYVPYDVGDVVIKLDGKEIPAKSTMDGGIIVLPYHEESTSSSDYRMYAVAYDVAPGSRATVEISYTRPPAPVTESDFLYELSFPKQPGLENATLAVKIAYPPSFLAEVKGQNPDHFLAKEGTLEYNTGLSGDERIRIVFTKR